MRKAITLPRRSKIRSRRTRLLIYTAFYIALITLLGYFIYSAFYLPSDIVQFIVTAVLSLFFPLLAFSYLLYRGYDLKKIIDLFGLARGKLTLRNIMIGMLVFVILFLMEILLGLYSTITGTQINTNVSTLLGGAPLWFLVFAAVVAPINEEIFFRGFLVPRVGIVLAALLFAIPHLSYNSTHFVFWFLQVEAIAAFIFGLLAGYVFKGTESLYPTIVAHILFNSLSLFVTLAILAH